jgi:hypothetical protein
MPKGLAPYFFPSEGALWENFELEMRELKERTAVVILPLSGSGQETRKRKYEMVEDGKASVNGVIKRALMSPHIMQTWCKNAPEYTARRTESQTRSVI